MRAMLSRNELNAAVEMGLEQAANRYNPSQGKPFRALVISQVNISVRRRSLSKVAETAGNTGPKGLESWLGLDDFGDGEKDE